MPSSRRRFLGALGTSASLAVAGCSSGGGGGDGPTREDAPAEFRLNGTTLNLGTPVRLEDAATDEMVVNIHGHGDTNHWHRAPLQLQVGEWRSYEIVFRDFDGKQIPLGINEQYQARITVPGDIDFLQYELGGTQLNLRGTEAGGASVRIELVADGEVQWTPPELSVSVQG
jgi:hypothetical protein